MADRRVPFNDPRATIAGRISAPAPFLFLKWRMTMPERSLGYRNESVYRVSRDSLHSVCREHVYK